jgi:hypothetical protein
MNAFKMAEKGGDVLTKDTSGDSTGVPDDDAQQYNGQDLNKPGLPEIETHGTWLTGNRNTRINSQGRCSPGI